MADKNFRVGIFLNKNLLGKIQLQINGYKNQMDQKFVRSR